MISTEKLIAPGYKNTRRFLNVYGQMKSTKSISELIKNNIRLTTAMLTEQNIQP